MRILQYNANRVCHSFLLNKSGTLSIIKVGQKRSSSACRDCRSWRAVSFSISFAQDAVLTQYAHKGSPPCQSVSSNYPKPRLTSINNASSNPNLQEQKALLSILRGPHIYLRVSHLVNRSQTMDSRLSTFLYNSAMGLSYGHPDRSVRGA